MMTNVPLGGRPASDGAIFLPSGQDCPSGACAVMGNRSHSPPRSTSAVRADAPQGIGTWAERVPMERSRSACPQIEYAKNPVASCDDVRGRSGMGKVDGSSACDCAAPIPQDVGPRVWKPAALSFVERPVLPSVGAAAERRLGEVHGVPATSEGRTTIVARRAANRAAGGGSRRCAERWRTLRIPRRLHTSFPPARPCKRVRLPSRAASGLDGLCDDGRRG